jgi:AcrR family transcriptional regulator
MTGRGAYAKGVAKREEILERGLDVVAREGYRGASVKQIADAVGLSQAGLLHYFDSKEELFTAILRKRDELDKATLYPPGSHDDLRALCEGYLRLIRRNSERPGAVLLFSRVAVDAADGDHPAREFFRERADTMRETFAAAISNAQAAGTVDAGLDAAVIARIVQAVSDGLQLQWLQDASVDMAAAVDALFAALGITPRPETS